MRDITKSRYITGEYHLLVKDLQNSDEERHHMYFRM